MPFLYSADSVLSALGAPAVESSADEGETAPSLDIKQYPYAHCQVKDGSLRPSGS